MHASIRWYALGREVPSPNQLELYGGMFVYDTHKLQVIFDKVTEDTNEDKAADLLLDNCHTIGLPVAGMEKEGLEKSEAMHGIHCTDLN